MALELAQWRLFLVVAERGSLLQAADVLHTNQPALSRSLRRLERLIGAPLFVRSSRGLALTELGRRLREPARALLDQAAAVEQQALAEARQATGVLRIGAVDAYPMNAILAEATQGLGVGGPGGPGGQGIRAELVGLPWLAHPRAVLDRTVDVGFTLTVDGHLPEPKLLRSRKLWDDVQGFALLSDRHALAEADVVDLRDLADLPLHLPTKADNPDIYRLTLEVLAEAGVPAPRRAPAVSTLANVMAHIAAGNGWMLTTGTVAANVTAGTVARPLAGPSRRAVQYQMVWHVNADQAAVAAFSERLDAAIAVRRPA
jgi:DNA-binding transcriptional LysR family regulator